MIKLIASDMDGTLLNSSSRISDENLKAIRYAESKGIIFCIATGRDYSAVKPVLDDYNLKCQSLVMSGAEYRDVDGTILEQIRIDKSKLKDILNVFREFGICPEIVTNNGYYTCNKKEYDENLKERFGMHTSEKSEEEINEIQKQFKSLFETKEILDLEKFIEDEDLDVFKVLSYHADEILIKNAKTKLREICGLSVESTFRLDIEITNIEAQKGLILAKVCKQLGLEKDEVMILGDSFNDYSMFKEFKNSFAMENAIEEVKEIAKYITSSNDEDGVAKAIYKMIK